jgi:hypothetical protein
MGLGEDWVYRLPQSSKTAYFFLDIWSMSIFLD